MAQLMNNLKISGPTRRIPLFLNQKRAALDFALTASQIPNNVDKSISDELHKYWDDGEIIEILGVISLFGYLNRWNDSMGTTLETEAIKSGEKHLHKTGWNIGKH